MAICHSFKEYIKKEFDNDFWMVDESFLWDNPDRLYNKVEKKEKESYSTIVHMNWLGNLDLSGLNKETPLEYMITYDYLVAKLERLIKELKNLHLVRSMWKKYIT